VSEAIESPSLKNVKNNIMNLINLTEIMIMIIIAVSGTMCLWVSNSGYLYHQNVKIYATSINSCFSDDDSFKLTDQKYTEIK